MGMDKQTDGQTKEWTNRRTDKWTNIYSLFRDKLSLPEGSLDKFKKNIIQAQLFCTPMTEENTQHLPRTFLDKEDIIVGQLESLSFAELSNDVLMRLEEGYPLSEFLRR